MSKIDYIEKLGWVYQDHFNNRVIYELGKDSVCTYFLFEHCGDIGILHDGVFNYWDLNEQNISRFTDVLKERINMMHNPKDYTLYQAQQNSIEILDLLEEFKEKK